MNNKYNEKIAVLKKIKKQTENYWGATKELPSNIKFFINTRDYIKNPDKYSKEEIAKAIANRKLILKDIGKGILLPTVGIATSGKTIYTINKLVNNGHNKTASLSVKNLNKSLYLLTGGLIGSGAVLGVQKLKDFFKQRNNPKEILKQEVMNTLQPPTN